MKHNKTVLAVLHTQRGEVGVFPFLHEFLTRIDFFDGGREFLTGAQEPTGLEGQRNNEIEVGNQRTSFAAIRTLEASVSVSVSASAARHLFQTMFAYPMSTTKQLH